MHKYILSFVKRHILTRCLKSAVCLLLTAETQTLDISVGQIHNLFPFISVQGST